ncbi:MAG: hypothetical protein KF745_04945 [Phycisphaeraceae bacterium]|nr:hypothetical protein [Phycisphaeraceae bacterium]
MSEGLSWNKLKAIAAGPRRLGLIALVALALTFAFALVRAWPLVRALAMSPPDDKPAAQTADSSALAADLNLYVERITGRSLFFTPRPPPPPRVETTDNRTPDPGPSRPTRYAGPALIAMINDTAWFANGDRLRAGDARSETVDLKVIEITPPWTARVEWEGVEFTVSLFERSPLIADASAPAPLEAEPPPKRPAPPRPSGSPPDPQPPAPGEPPPEPAPDPDPLPDPPHDPPPQPEPQPDPQPEPAPSSPSATDSSRSEIR